jgi:hypothetical protein
VSAQPVNGPQSAGVILRILNLVALADGGVSLEEENLLDSLSKEYKLQAKIINWKDQLSDPACIEELAALINPEATGTGHENRRDGGFRIKTAAGR